MNLTRLAGRAIYLFNHRRQRSLTDPVPTQNSCQCETSCKDENDYYCRPNAGFSFIGKNCDYEAVSSCTSTGIKIRIPQAAVDEYARGIHNVGIHGCTNGVCSANSAVCGPARVSINGFYELECPSLIGFDGTGLAKEVTFVMDRINELISMPRAMTRVVCRTEIRPAVAVIRPGIRTSGSMEQIGFWRPVMSFWKTAWDVRPGVPASFMETPQGEIVYIVGEMLHVRVTAKNGLGSSLQTMELDICTVSDNMGKSITLIDNGVVDRDVPFTVVIDMQKGFVGNGSTPGGVGFHFQMFQFAPGTTIFLTCRVNVNPSRRRRSSNSLDEKNAKEIQIKFIVVKKEEKEEIIDDLANLIVKEQVFDNQQTMMEK
ncbi:unnamed protein product [Oikopleura dioica]|uniref:ZP domain-containing protein n=1 Tax=Oikopleura dioica TaxID=34765 RepID=E4Y723_OIKDI|nr:unnamed protein product [Oikopleura dioica]